MKIFIGSLLLLTSLAFIRLLPTIMNLCSFDCDDVESRPAFLFNPELTGTAGLRPLYFTWNPLYDNSWDECLDGRKDNIDEWGKYFNSKLGKKEIEILIYSLSLNDLKQLDSLIKNPSEREPSSKLIFWKDFFYKNNDKEFLTYICFAKECEPAVDFNSWEVDEHYSQYRDTMNLLITKGEELYHDSKSEFIKLRYGYQIVRLAHYAKEYKKCIELYDKYITPLEVNSVIQYWVLEQKAGALAKLGRKAEAAHYFATLFDLNPARRDIIYRSFNISNDSIWTATFKLCKTSREKATLYFLRGLEPINNILEEMENIYVLDPSSEKLNLLLVREINKYEDRKFKVDPYGNCRWGEDIPFDSSVTKHMNMLKNFVSRCVKENRILNPELWTLASGYLNFLTENYDEARSILSGLKESKDSIIQRQLPLIELAIDVAATTRLTKYAEDSLFACVLSTEHNQLVQYTVDAFRELAPQEGDTIKAFWCNHSISDFRPSFNIEKVEELLAWENKHNSTQFEKYIISRSDAHPEELRELKGTILFSQHKLQEAIDEYKKSTSYNLRINSVDPFSIRIKDCRDCDFRMGTEKPYSKLTLVSTILGYEEKLKSDPDNAAQYHYLLGNVYYNTTYFGNSAEVVLYYHDCDNMWYGRDYEIFIETGEIPIYLDCSRAQYHYRQGMSIAQASGDVELAAECCFMAAKCEQNKYYVTNTQSDGDGKIKNAKFRTFFSLLKNNYASTKFYLKAINECKYFNEYINSSKQ